MFKLRFDWYIRCKIYRRHTDPDGRYDQNEIKRSEGLNYFAQNCPIIRFAILDERATLDARGVPVSTFQIDYNLRNIPYYYPTALRRVQVQISRGICTPGDRSDRFPAVDQSVSWISRANSVPLRILLPRIPYK